MWKHASSPSPVKARLSTYVGKEMAIIFCDTKKRVLNHMAPVKTAFKSMYCANLILIPLQTVIRDKRLSAARSGCIKTTLLVIKVNSQEVCMKAQLHLWNRPNVSSCCFYMPVRSFAWNKI